MKFLLWGRILKPALITPFYHITVHKSSLAGAYSSFSTPKRARILVWEQHLSGTQRLNQKRWVELCVGGIFMTTALTNVSQFRRAHPWSGADPDCHLSENGGVKVQRLEKPKVEQERPVYEWMFCLGQRSPCRCYRESGSNLSHTITTALILLAHGAQPISLDYSTIFREKITASGIHMEVLWPWKIIYDDR